MQPHRWIEHGCIRCIQGYRRWISPCLPPSCRFAPTCSEYAIQSLETHSIFNAFKLILMRLLKCHPLHPGGFDPVPPTPQSTKD